MNHRNFINSRSYSNEATLFINPTKNKKHKSSKPKIVIHAAATKLEDISEKFPYETSD